MEMTMATTITMSTTTVKKSNDEDPATTAGHHGPYEPVGLLIKEKDKKGKLPIH